jgi:hypothetical protein
VKGQTARQLVPRGLSAITNVATYPNACTVTANVKFFTISIDAGDRFVTRLLSKGLLEPLDEAEAKGDK